MKKTRNKTSLIRLFLYEYIYRKKDFYYQKTREEPCTSFIPKARGSVSADEKEKIKECGSFFIGRIKILLVLVNVH
jgi:hypothetical protein